MKYLVPLLAGGLLFGAGCSSLPFASPPSSPLSPVAAVPVPPSPPAGGPVGKIAITDELKNQFEADYQEQTSHRKDQALPAGHYFISVIEFGQGPEDYAIVLAERSASGTYRIISQDLGDSVDQGLYGGTRNSVTLILEPKGRDVVYLLTAYDKGVSRVSTFDLAKGATTEPSIADSDFVVAPTEDRLLYIVDSTDGCAPGVLDATPESPCVDYGRSLSILDLATGSISGFARLPKGYSFVRSVYPPNSMGEGLHSAGDLTWVGPETIRAIIYSDKAAAPCEYCGAAPRKVLKTVEVKVGQADAMF